MQAIAQLCDRAILLDGGEIVRDGAERRCRRALPADRPRQRLEQRVARLDDAPGDEPRAAALDPRRRRGRRGRVDTVDVRRPVGIEIGFTVLRARRADLPEDQGRSTGRGRHRVQRARHDPRWHEPAPPGRLRRHGLDPGEPAERGPVHASTSRSARSGRPKLITARRRAARRLVPRARPGRRRLRPRTFHGPAARRRAAAARVDDRETLANAEPDRRHRSRPQRGRLRRAGDPQRRARSATGSMPSITFRPTGPGRSSSASHGSIRPPRRTARRTTPASRTSCIEPYAGTTPGCSASTATSSTTPPGSPAFARSCSAARYDSVFKVASNVLNCVELDPGAQRARGYLSPPSRSITKLYNFAAIESWHGDGSERLHGGTIVFRPATTSRPSTTSASGSRGTKRRCAVCTVAFSGARASTAEPDDPSRRPILEETRLAGPQLARRPQAAAATAVSRRTHPRGSGRSTCAATSSPSTRRPFFQLSA